MQLCTVHTLTSLQKTDIYQLWNQEYPQSITYKAMSEFESYLAKQEAPIHFIFVDKERKVRGWLAKFTRDQGRWFSLIVDSKIQGQGYGSQLLQAAKQGETELNGWMIDHDRDKKLDGSAYLSPYRFYQKNGFALIAEERLENELLSSVKIRWKI